MAVAIPYVTALAAVVLAGSSMYYSNKNLDLANKTRKEQQAAILKATAEAKAERERIDNLEAERLERLRKRGAQLPPSLITGMSGVEGAPVTKKPILGR